MPETFRLEFEAIGTSWVIDIVQNPPPNLKALKKKIEDEIAGFSKIFSRFDENSEILKAARSGGRFAIPVEYLPLVCLYQKLYILTGGVFTPLVGNILEDAGYDRKYSLSPKKIRPVLNWEEAIDLKKNILKIIKPAVLDFGAGGKGFLVDLVGKILEEGGIESFCIDAGGDILYASKQNETIRVGLENPENIKQVIGVADVKNGSICGSAVNRRRWDKYHHIINPLTLEPVKNILAVWVIADTALLADCLSTCLFLIPPEKLTGFNFKYLILKPDYTIDKSADFPAEIFYN
ncbi:MAG TPA: FAD:protein FMN transferase [Patescibacteria group bacterium]|nr:FAD:protein FMN transferase [Patescibacteria group bacterium]